MHTHEHEDEISHVTAGRLGVQIGDEVLEAGPGDTVVKPRGIAHAFWNPGDEPVRFLELITPPASRATSPSSSRSSTSTGPPDFAALGAVMAPLRPRMDMDSMPRLIAEHGLDAPPA